LDLRKDIMKLALMSDVHLEFGMLDFDDQPEADVLILSGDICTAVDFDTETQSAFTHRGERYLEFFSNAAAKYKTVVYVMGNHEHYNGDYQHSAKWIKQALVNLPNVHLLDKELLQVEDVTFIGGTLWTDMNGGDISTHRHVSGCMNDFRIVGNGTKQIRVPEYERDEDGTILYTEEDGYRKAKESGFKFVERSKAFTTEDAVDDHKAMIEFIRLMIEGKFDQKFVVVGHHAPSKQSTKPQYQDDVLMNGGYSSDLTSFIIDHPQIKVWTHGHTHDEFEYKVGETTVVCNPRGYVNYERKSQKDHPYYAKIIEV